VPRHGSGLLHRAGHGHHGAETWHGPGRVPDEEPDPTRTISVHVGNGLAIRFRRLSHGDDQGDGIGQLQKAARGAEGEAGGVQARGHTRTDGHRRCVLHRNRWRRAVAQLRHPRHCHVRFRRNSHPSHRHWHLPARNEVAGSGARNDLRPDHRDRARTSRRQHHSRGRQYRHGALWTRYLWFALDASFGRGNRNGLPQDQSQGADDRRLLEVHDDDLEWDVDRFRVKGNPERFKTMTELAWAAHHEVPPGMEPGLEAVNYYDPPNFTFPFGAYICVVDIDVDTGQTKVRRFYALDDCGTRINPMIIEGQIHGGLTEAFGIPMGQEIHYDQDGNVTTASFLDYFLPTAVETPRWETDWTTTPSPHHPIGAKGVGESPNVGGVPCFSNAVNDAFAFLGSTHIQMPHDHWRTWMAAEKLGLHA